MKLVIIWECITTSWMEVDRTLIAGNIQMDLESSVINVQISNQKIGDKLLDISLAIQKIAAMDSWDIIIIHIIGQIAQFDSSNNTMCPRIGVDAWKLDQANKYAV